MFSNPWKEKDGPTVLFCFAQLVPCGSVLFCWWSSAVKELSLFFLSVRCLRDEICPEYVWALCLSAVLSSECRPHTELSKQSRELKAHQTEGLTGCEDTALFDVLLPFLSTLKQISRPPEPELCHGELFLLCAQQAVSLSLIPLV